MIKQYNPTNYKQQSTKWSNLQKEIISCSNKPWVSKPTPTPKIRSINTRTIQEIKKEITTTEERG